MSNLAETIRAAISSAEPIDWPALREEIHLAHEGAKSTDERVHHLQLFKELMDHVADTQVASSDIPNFNDIRAKDYRLLLVQEAMVGDNACVETLDEITRREIAAGRMAPDDELRRVTIEGLAKPHLTRAQLEAMTRPKQSIWSKLLGR